MTEYNYSIIGPGGVGKSSLVIQFVCNHFVDAYDPTISLIRQFFRNTLTITYIEDSYRKQVNIDGETALIDVLDTAVCLNEKYIFTHKGSRRVLINEGNKIDLVKEREVSKEEAIALAKALDAPYFETSAKDRINVDEIFFECVREIRRATKNADWWKGKYRSSATFYGDGISGLSELVSHLSEQQVQIPPYVPSRGQGWSNPYSGCEPIIVKSKKHSRLCHRVWASDPRVSDCRSPIPRPAFLCFFCFSVVNRTSFDRVIKKWKELKAAYRQYQMISILVGLRTDLREWLASGKKAVAAPTQQNIGPSQTTYQPFNSVPEEIILHVFSYLPMVDNVIFTCKRFAKIAQHPSLAHIKGGVIQLPAITKKEAEKMLSEMKGVKYVECSVRNGIGLEELSLDDLFDTYMKEKQEKFIHYSMEMATNGPQQKKKKKKRFLFF